jgi:magnesium transporter
MLRDAMVARLFAQGSDQVEEIDLGSALERVDDRSILWVDVTRADDEAVEKALGVALGRTTWSGQDRVTFRSDEIRLTLTALREASRPAAAVDLGFLLTRNIVLTLHDEPVRGLADPIMPVAEDPRFGRLDAGRFAGLLIEGVLHGYDDAIEELDEEIDRLEARVLRHRPRDDALEAIVDLRQRASDVRRWLAPQRTLLAALTRPVEDEPSPIGQPDAEVVAHLGRTLESVEHTRDRLLGTFDILMARTSQRTNDVMRVLTVVSAVLLPSVVIAGVMGMNFPAPLFDEPALFYVVVALMVALAVGTLVLARLRRWI